jgi:hypothetical protein
MARRINAVIDMDVDEISLVDIPAAPGARVAIAKRASEEDTVPEIYDEQGNPVDPDALVLGQTVYDADGEAYEVVPDDNADDDVEDFADDRELVEVGKSFRGFDADLFRSELSKSVTDIERDEVISKAFGTISSLERELAQATEIAKAEQNIRLTREYVEVAKSYNIPTSPDVLGPVLMRMAETMSDADCSVIHKALTGAGSALFKEVGYIGGADNADVMSQVDAAIEASISKSGAKISKAEATAEFFELNPEAYDEYLADKAMG